MKTKQAKEKKCKKIFSLKYKLMIVFGLLATVSTATLSFFAITIAKDVAIDKVKTHLINEAEDVAHIIDASIQADFRYLRTVGRTLLQENAASVSHTEQAIRLQQEAKAAGFKNLFFIDTKGIVHIFNGQKIPVSDREYFKSCMKGKPFMTEPYKDRLTGEMCMSIASPFYDKEKNIAGVILSDYDGLYLNKYIKDIIIGKTGFCYILDKKGTAIAHQDVKFVKKQDNLIENSKQDKTLVPIANFIQNALATDKSKCAFYKVKGKTVIGSFAKIPSTGWTVFLRAPASEFLGSIDRLQIILISFGSFMLLLALLIIFLISKKMLQPVTIASAFINNISSGDLTSEIDDKYTDLNDEVGLIASEVKGLQKRLIDIIGTIKIISTELATSSEETSATTKTFSGNAQSQAAALEQINATLEEITAGMDSINDNANGQIKSMVIITEGINFLKRVEQKIKNSVAYLSNQSHEISSQTQEGNSLLLTMQQSSGEIAKSSEQMLNIVKVINDVADQINLLSLNAAIESARAGEAGRGFAVVADEISKLADETQSNVKSIETSILENNAKIKQGEGIVNQSIEKLQIITEGVLGMAESVQGVDNEIDAQTEQSDALNSNIVEVKEKSESIQTGIQEMNIALGEITGSVGSVNQKVQATAGGSEEVAGGAEQVAKMSQQLQEKVDFFKIPE